MLNPPYPKWFTRSVALVLTLIVLLVDTVVPYEFNLSIFYILPIALGAWYVSARFSILLSFVSTVTWLTVDLLRETTYTYARVPYWNTLVRLGVFLIFAAVFAWLRTRLRHAERLATTDPLTRLTNRLAFNILVDKEVQRSKCYGYPVTIAYIDLDDFKLVNDRWGHDAGDQALRAVAEALQSGARSLDVVARLGGDEFAVLLPNTSTATAAGVLDRLRVRLHEAMSNRSLSITASIGAVTFTAPPTTVNDMLRRADYLMYSVKRGGKNQLRHQVATGG